MQQLHSPPLHLSYHRSYPPSHIFERLRPFLSFVSTNPIGSIFTRTVISISISISNANHWSSHHRLHPLCSLLQLSSQNVLRHPIQRLHYYRRLLLHPEPTLPTQQGSYVGIHSTGFRDFLLKPELLRAISDLGFEHPSEGKFLPSVPSNDEEIWNMFS